MIIYKHKNRLEINHKYTFDFGYLITRLFAFFQCECSEFEGDRLDLASRFLCGLQVDQVAWLVSKLVKRGLPKF